jgi:hypothetical protein
MLLSLSYNLSQPLLSKLHSSASLLGLEFWKSHFAQSR